MRREIERRKRNGYTYDSFSRACYYQGRFLAIFKGLPTTYGDNVGDDDTRCVKIFYRRVQLGNRTRVYRLPGGESAYCALSVSVTAETFVASHRNVLYRIVARNKIHSLNCLRYVEFHIPLNDVFMRDSFVTSRHVVEMKQTLKTFRRPNTQGKLHKVIFHDTSRTYYIENF